LVNSTGNIAPVTSKNSFDEIVVRESVQVLPVIMLTLDKYKKGDKKGEKKIKKLIYQF